MLRKIGVALVAAMLVAAPALAIETQSPTASPIAKPKKVSSSKIKTLAKNKSVGKTASKHQQRPAKISATTSAKAKQVVATKKSNQNATALPAKTKPKTAKSKIAKPKNDKSHQAKSNQAKSSQVKSQHAKSRMPADHTGSVAPRSVPTPGLY
jgi:hypothetical protein